MSRYFPNTDLLAVPTRRAAFSDRTAWLMAEMSRLAYFKFEGGNDIDEIVEQAEKLFPRREELKGLTSILRTHIVGSTEEDAKAAMGLILEESAGFELVETFVSDETDAQAFLCRHPDRKIAILSFRGTELNLKDIKADIKAKLAKVKVEGREFEIHSGYLAQFESLQEDISGELKKPVLTDHQLFLTGHSLGGALAITATKFLANDVTGACYTFGSPPVGTKDFDRDIHTPIYRVVNHVDIVPRLPNPILVYVMRALVFAIEMALTPFASLYSRIKETRWYNGLQELLLDAQRYRQSGYNSFLVGRGEKVRLRYSVGVHDRLYWWIKQFGNIFRGDFKIISDHSIEVYSRKLGRWAEDRRK